MKKTIIALLALSGISMAATHAWIDTSASTEFNLPADLTLENGTTANRLIENGNVGVSTIKINTTGDTTIGAIDGNGLDNIANVTLTLNGKLTLKSYAYTDNNGEEQTSDAYVKFSTKSDWTTTFNLGTTGSFELTSSKALNLGASSTINATLAANETERLLMKADNINVTPITLNITPSAGYTYGGLVYSVTKNNETKYYASAASSGNYWSVSGDAINLEDGKVYAVAGLLDTKGASMKTISLLATPVSVPEPTTATLSLLALAGLAARRRRK